MANASPTVSGMDRKDTHLIERKALGAKAEAEVSFKVGCLESKCRVAIAAWPIGCFRVSARICARRNQTRTLLEQFTLATRPPVLNALTQCAFLVPDLYLTPEERRNPF